MHQHLLSVIQQRVRLSQADIDLCIESFEPVLLPKNRIIEEEGKVPKYLYFIISGYVRLFYNDEAGNEITTHINCPPGFITSYSAFTNQTRSNENVACITDCELLRITKPDLDKLLEQSDSFKNFSLAVFQESLNYNETRSKELATLSAEQRYKKLLTGRPDILQNVPIQFIASFLGMKPESLSRIRKQLNA